MHRRRACEDAQDDRSRSAARSFEFDEADERKVALKLSDAARKALRKRKQATLIATATATHGGGHTERATARRKLD